MYAYPPPQAGGSNNLIIIIAIIAICAYIYYTQFMSTSGSTSAGQSAVVAVATPSAPSDQVVGAYIAPLPTATGPTLRDVGCYFSDTILELYPDTGYSGWDLTGTPSTNKNYLKCNSKRTDIPVFPDGHSATLTADMVCFYQDRSVTQQLAWNGLIYTKSVFDTDKNGAKSIIFCQQRNGGQKSWAFESFKVFDGTYMMLTSCDPGQRGQPNNKAKGFMLGRQNISDISTLFDIYPELAAGNTGIFFNGWTQDLDFEVTCLDDQNWNDQMKQRREACLDLAMGGVPLTYDDGSPVNDTNGQQVVGRWMYLIADDYQGTIVLDPVTGLPTIVVDPTTGQPRWRKCGGWRLAFDDAADYCKWDGSVSELKPPIAAFIANSFSSVSVTNAATGADLGSINGANTLDAQGNAQGVVTMNGPIANGVNLNNGMPGLGTSATSTSASGWTSGSATAAPPAGTTAAAISTTTNDPTKTTYNNTSGQPQSSYSAATASPGLSTTPTYTGTSSTPPTVTATSAAQVAGATPTSYFTAQPSFSPQNVLSRFQASKEWFHSAFNPSAMSSYVELS